MDKPRTRIMDPDRDEPNKNARAYFNRNEIGRYTNMTMSDIYRRAMMNGADALIVTTTEKPGLPMCKVLDEGRFVAKHRDDFFSEYFYGKPYNGRRTF